MTKYEQVEYMMKCLELVKAEMDHQANYIGLMPDYETERDAWHKFMECNRNPSKSLIRDNLRNVGRVAFICARK